MDWNGFLNIKIRDLTSTKEFNDFKEAINADWFADEVSITFYNDCYAIDFYIETSYPIFHIVNFCKGTLWENCIPSLFRQQEEDFLLIKNQIEMSSLDDLLDDLPALQRTFIVFEFIRKFHPEILNEKFYPIYADNYQSDQSAKSSSLRKKIAWHRKIKNFKRGVYKIFRLN